MIRKKGQIVKEFKRIRIFSCVFYFTWNFHPQLKGVKENLTAGLNII